MTIRNIFVTTLVLLSASLAVAQETNVSTQVDCVKYLNRQDSLNRIKLEYFKTQILEPAKKSNSIPKSNIEFLEALYSHQNLSWVERESTPTLDKPIFPIFRLEEGQLGIFSFPKYNCYKNERGYTTCDNLSAERKVIFNNLSEENEAVYDPNPELKPNQDAFNKIVSKGEVIVFTSNTKYLDQVVQLSSYADECLEYYHYQLKNQTAEKPLFATRFELKLDIKPNSKIDKKIESQYAKGCYDCSFKYEPVKTFATLEGIDNIFFTYTDTFPLNNQLNNPERTIRMLLKDGTVVILWSESIDLFGCSCL
ncbi:hypothetical protein [Aureibacter tunicatorum]|uniref:Uncharacterized protein n=1 Tax=Aureibacter tunicatorum TaxID=866807 RepID=A0AAE3XJA1_9BACT|nr:hypothetical protein [Aureibacter tunicatorum]MDR6238776.1 hypothetical protein [Aureibacter tunicatorum]BDD05293.1 hypothetical protein AUTU_27760 [Aureibacter tunicatorum]